MKDKVIRIRINDVLYKKFLLLCIQADTSVPKQTANLIRDYITENRV